MNFFSKRELDDLTSPGIDGVMWLVIGLGVGYWLTDGVENFWARLTIVVFAGVGITQAIITLTEAIDRWRERRRGLVKPTTEERLRRRVAGLEKEVSQLEAQVEHYEDDEEEYGDISS